MTACRWFAKPWRAARRARPDAEGGDLRELGPPERLLLETFASKPLIAGQVRVALRAAGINFPDILMAAGEYQLKPELPFTPGMEAAATWSRWKAPRKASRSAIA